MSADGLHRVRRVWAMRTASEYRSATLAAQYTHWLLRLGLPPDLVRQAMRVTSDELEHAERCFALSQAAGGAEPQAPVPETWLELGQDPEASSTLR